ncbi:hypothetical protein N9866_04575, partial [Flavobacteriaceae bacterium]|nr:hypothetical protein [Flavobacteriaceae bacterium]
MLLLSKETWFLNKSKLLIGIIILLGFLFTKCTFVIPDEITQEMESLPEVVDFNYHIKPILSDRCFKCHGP